MTRRFSKFLVVTTLALCVFTIGAPKKAHAEGFISPLIGFNFGGAAGCPAITGCQDKRLNVGIALGSAGSLFGAEQEIAYAKDFFGTAPNLSSSVLTVMSNFMVAPKIGPVRPYFVTGLGLIRTHVELVNFTTTSLLTTNNNNFGWDVGGGVVVSVAPHVGIRGDIRYFHSFQDLGFVGFSLGTSSQLNFGRAAAAVNFNF